MSLPMSQHVAQDCPLWYLLLSSLTPDFLLSLALSLFFRSLLRPLLCRCYARNDICEWVVDNADGLYFWRTSFILDVSSLDIYGLEMKGATYYSGRSPSNSC